MRDSASQQPVAFATVVLWPKGALAGPPAASASTDAQGRFTLAVAPGTFRLQVSLVGYATHQQQVVVAEPVALALIWLVPAPQQLGEAVVVGTRPLVEVQPDRLVYHASQDVGNAGGTGQDVLRHTPLLAVDNLGSVTLRGSGNFKVLINNKPAPALTQNLAQALKSLPADQILRVEVVTTPSAKNDGEGTAGLVNIVLKKATGPALNGRLGASGGNQSSETTAALGWKRGKVGSTLAVGAGGWREPDFLTRRRLDFTSTGPADTLTQSGRRQNTGTWYNASLGLDYDLAAHHSFSLLAVLSGYQAQGQRALLSQLSSANAAVNQLFTRATTDYVGSLGTELTGTYTRTFARARREWSVLGQYAATAGTAGYGFDQYTNSRAPLNPAQADYRERSQGRTPSRELTAQTDFTQPLGAKSTLEVGTKAIFRRTGSVAEVAGSAPGQALGLAPLPGRGTSFSYQQQVQAAYASYATAPGKQLTATLGARLERTADEADFGAGGGSLPPRSYYSPLPSASLRYAFSDTSSLRLAYSRRITRPSIDFLNPFVDRSNPQNITYGNPTLAAELTDAYEASYATGMRTATLLLTGAVRHTGRAIEAVRLPTSTPGVTAQTFANVAATTYYQLTLYGTAKFTQRWEVSGGPNAQYVVFLSPDRELLRRGFSAGMNVDTSYHFTRKLTAQASLAAALPAPTLQGQGSASLYYTLGVKKTVFGDQADLVLNLANPFTDSFPNRSSLATAFLDERTEYRTYQRSLRLSFNYRFGQEDPARPHKKASNDDLKSR
ncbi:TonB-dependent receptor [Hymenobacter sp. RP-2-7]|uniref:TonB-dependent receptor n=1 Tax=Hymenobacter polaris TaxID=2682546 RepID=A0A7Y0AG30_9BACT|nr:TonB-dependent receptor [Hymenobacter polaris]